MPAAELKKFDGSYVSIRDVDGNVFEGCCTYNSREYNEHEFGIARPALQIANFLFTTSDIEKIESLEDHSGPYGKFTTAYGLIEDLNFEDGPDCIDEELFSDDEELVWRMLLCLDAHLDPSGAFDHEDSDEIVEMVKELEKYAPSERCRKAAQELLKACE